MGTNLRVEVLEIFISFPQSFPVSSSTSNSTLKIQVHPKLSTFYYSCVYPFDTTIRGSGMDILVAQLTDLDMDASQRGENCEKCEE